jgi:peptidoglycan/LPS O-acetylase OafA/YrhL
MFPANHARTSPITSRLAGLDHLRAFAIIFVFLFHYRLFHPPTWVNDIGSFGWTGVDLFFVLSGYLIGGQLLQRIARHQPLEYGTFFFKRFMRIIPAYLVVLVLYFTIPAFREKESLSPLWRFLTFTQNFGLDASTTGTFSHSWSLCIEEQFYLLLPLIIMGMMALKAGKRAFYLVILLFLLGFVVRHYSWMHFIAPFFERENPKGYGVAFFKWVYYPTYNRLDGLLVGVAIAGLFQFKPLLANRIIRHGNVLLLLGLLLITGAYFLCEDMTSWQTAVLGYPLIAIAYGILLLAALSPATILYRFSSRITTFIAAISYSVYLTHKQLIHLTQELLAPNIPKDSNTAFWASVVVSLLGGWLLHLIVEKPFLRLREVLLKKYRQPQKAVPVSHPAEVLQ